MTAKESLKNGRFLGGRGEGAVLSRRDLMLEKADKGYKLRKV